MFINLNMTSAIESKCRKKFIENMNKSKKQQNKILIITKIVENNKT